MSSGYEIQETGHITGPHSLLVLRQKAEIHVLKPGTLVRAATVSPALAADWLPIREIPELHALLFPDRVAPRLSATSVVHEATNTRVDAAQPATDVFQLLRDNTTRQVAAEGELLKPHPPRPNGRLRDYIIVATALNGFVGVAGHYVGYHNPFLVALWTMGNVGLAWVLFFVMDRY